MGELKRRGDAASSEPVKENNLKEKLKERLKKQYKDKGDLPDDIIEEVAEMTAKVQTAIKELGRLYIRYMQDPNEKTGTELVTAINKLIDEHDHNKLAGILMAGIEAQIKLVERDYKGE